MSDNGHPDKLMEEAIVAAREEGYDVAEVIEELPYDPAMITAAQEADLLCTMAEWKLPTLDPDGDLIPMTVLSGERGFIPMLHPWENDVDKAAIMEGAMPEIAQAVGLRAFGQITMAWMLPDDAVSDPRRDDFIPPSEHPSKLEIVAVTTCDGITAHMRSREVIRRPDGPPEWKHEAWEAITMQAIDVGGLMLQSLLAALFTHRVARAAHLILWNRPREWWTDERLEAMKRVGHTIMEGGGRGPRGRREMHDIKGGSDLEDQVILGTLVRDGDGDLGLAPEVMELARSENLWAYDTPDDDAATTPGGIPW